MDSLYPALKILHEPAEAAKLSAKAGNKIAVILSAVLEDWNSKALQVTLEAFIKTSYFLLHKAHQNKVGILDLFQRGEIIFWSQAVKCPC